MMYHQQRYDVSYQQCIQQPTISNNTVNITPSHNHHHNYRQLISSTDNVTISPDNKHHESNNINYHDNNQQFMSSPLQFFSPQSNMFPPSVSIIITSPQTNFINMPNAVSCLFESSFFG
jgi:hypothetical protein